MNRHILVLSALLLTAAMTAPAVVADDHGLDSRPCRPNCDDTTTSSTDTTTMDDEPKTRPCRPNCDDDTTL